MADIYDALYAKGFNRGLERAREKGHSGVSAELYAEGFAEGYVEGFLDGRLKVLSLQLEGEDLGVCIASAFDITVDQAAKLLEIPAADRPSYLAML